MQASTWQAHWPVGSFCEALYDDKWYEATVHGHTEAAVLVVYTGYEEVVEVSVHFVLCVNSSAIIRAYTIDLSVCMPFSLCAFIYDNRFNISKQVQVPVR